MSNSSCVIKQHSISEKMGDNENYTNRRNIDSSKVHPPVLPINISSQSRVLKNDIAPRFHARYIAEWDV
jgi:hypothetical protein